MRDKFEPTGPIPIVEIKLDTGNYRYFDQLDTQESCVAAMLDDPKSYVINLAADIAKMGNLTPQPIVVSKDDSGDWVVRDGNRRITALKLLNQPSLCRENHTAKVKIESILKRYGPNFPKEIDCLYCADEPTILEYISRQHGGLQDGIGQKEWEAINKAYYAQDTGGKTQNERALHLMKWLGKKGVTIPPNFPITTLTRMLGDDMRQELGFDWKDKEFWCVDEELFLKVFTQIANDLGSKAKQVDEVKTPELRAKYLAEVFTKTGTEPADTNLPMYKLGATRPTPGAPGDKEGSEAGSGSSSNSGSESASGAGSTSGFGRGSAPSKQSWDRPRLISPKTTNLNIPKTPENLRARNLFQELSREIDVRKAPNAASVMMRLLLEFSVDRFSDTRNITQKNDKLADRAYNAARFMFSNGMINKDNFEQIEKIKEAKALNSAHTLHKYVHSTNYHPDAQTLCTFWDSIEFFICECWK